jgi:NAD(P)H-dependent FMN reductase
MSAPHLSIVIASTRPGRIGGSIGTWTAERARQHGAFDVHVVDLAEVNLPFIDEPKHPRMHQYEHEHTKAWSKTIGASDAFVFVVPEYDYSLPATLLNALQFLYTEWNYKACAFVSYGGISGGTRSAHMGRQVASTLRMMGIPEAVAIPFVNKALHDGVFQSEKLHDDSAKAMFDELAKWTGALRGLRS